MAILLLLLLHLLGVRAEEESILLAATVVTQMLKLSEEPNDMIRGKYKSKMIANLRGQETSFQIDLAQK